MWQNQRFKEENDKSQERLEKLTIQANELNIIDKIIENETRKLQEAQKSLDDFCDACEFSTISGLFMQSNGNDVMIVEKMRSHITTINRLYAQLERIIHGNHSEDAQKCFREVTKAADCAINLCYFFENWKEKDITDNKYVTDYYKKYKSALWARAMFLNIQESKLNMILYKNMSLDEIRKELNPEKKDNVN